MSTILLRLGLWTIVAVLALFILTGVMEGSPLSETITHERLNLIGMGGLVLVGLGIIAAIGEWIGRRFFRHSFCIVCHRKVRYGDLYCREHLRNTVHTGDETLRRHPGGSR